MIYLDNGATSFQKPPQVRRAMLDAMEHCANPGRGGYEAAMRAANVVYRCREDAGQMFGCDPEQVIFTANCTQGLNMAIRSLIGPGSRVVISGFEHNAVTRPLHGLGAKIIVAGRKLFDWEDTLSGFHIALKDGADAAVFTHVSNVFGYILPVAEMAALCKKYRVPFVIDGAQSAGNQSISLEKLGAAYIAMPGHKGLLGPQGTGLLLCGHTPRPLLFGGTGTASRLQTMPEELPERMEAGTLNVPGIAGLAEGLRYVLAKTPEAIGKREAEAAAACARDLKKLGVRVFAGAHQAGTVSFVPEGDCEVLAEALGQKGIAVRAGLHCAPLAHESAGTLDSGTVRVSFGHDATLQQAAALVRGVREIDVM